MKRFARIVITILEFALAFLFVQGGVNAILIDEIPVAGPLLGLLIGKWVIVAYGILWILAGTLLIASRYLKWVRIHGISLMVMYLSCVYVMVLEYALSGWSWSDQWLTIAVGLASAGLYLRWKYVTKPVPVKEDEI